MAKIGILFQAKTAADELAHELEKVLSQLGASVWLCPIWDEEKAKELIVGTEKILSLGGDGTMLRVARLAAPRAIPILGINLGNLGFAAELQGREALDRISDILSGKGWIDERTMLQVEAPQTSAASLHALNDVVISRSTISHIIRIKAFIDGSFLTTYRVDGVIVATATGSTGYSLAVGGPILYPQAKEILLTPISPHLTLTKALVLPAEAIIELVVQTEHEARLSIDGQAEFTLHNGDVVKVKRSPYTTRLLRFQPPSFFYQTLLQKLSSRPE